jgi:hypothetical protein
LTSLPSLPMKTPALYTDPSKSSPNSNPKGACEQKAEENP